MNFSNQPRLYVSMFVLSAFSRCKDWAFLMICAPEMLMPEEKGELNEVDRNTIIGPLVKSIGNMG